MTEQNRKHLIEIEGHAQEDPVPLEHLRAVVARYSILPSRAAKRAYEFVIAATAEEFDECPPTAENRKYFNLLTETYQQYNIRPSKATKDEHEFVVDITEKAFFDEQSHSSDSCDDCDLNVVDSPSLFKAEVYARRLKKLLTRMEIVGRKEDFRDALGCSEKMGGLFREFGIGTDDNSIRMCNGAKDIIDEVVELGMKLLMDYQELFTKMKALGRAKEFLDALDDDDKMDALLLEF